MNHLNTRRVCSFLDQIASRILRHSDGRTCPATDVMFREPVVDGSDHAMCRCWRMIQAVVRTDSPKRRILQRGGDSRHEMTVEPVAHYDIGRPDTYFLEQAVNPPHVPGRGAMDDHLVSKFIEQGMVNMVLGAQHTEGA